MSQKVGNCRFDALTLVGSRDLLIAYMQGDNPAAQHSVINAGKVVLANTDAELARIINECFMVNIDGMGVVWGTKFLGLSVPERVAGIDLALSLLDGMQSTGLSVYLLGATEEVVQATKVELERRFPNLTIAGFRNGFWKPDEETGVVSAIKQSGADLLLLGFPSPKKEYFASKYLSDFGTKVVFGVGGTFDVIAGKTLRAPRWMQRSGLEWFFRFIQEPRRMFKRYLIGNLRFLKIVIQQKLR